MAVLSDEAIRGHIQAGRLVRDGDLSRALECSYSFVPGAAFEPGSVNRPVDFPGAEGKAEVIVKPGQMIWIRTLETVQIPDTMVGFWWQTNTLSRQGLMLVNMSMVEPGYVGDLACLFVNFGNSNVVVGSNTIIAKMVFMELTGNLAHPYRNTHTREQYDKTLRDLSINQPSSFLKIGDLAKDLSIAQAEALAEIAKAASEAKAETTKAIGDTESEAKKRLESALDDAQSEALKGFKDDTAKVLKGSFAMVVLAVVLLGLIATGADWAKTNWLPDFHKVARSEAEKLLQERVTISATPDTTEKAELKKLIEELNTRIGVLEKKK